MILGGILIVVGVILSLPNAFAALVPVESITITSSKLDYNKKEPGSYDIVKSAEWLGKGKARITFDLDTVMKKENKYRDIILVLDVSGSMEREKLAKVKQDSIELINELLSDSNNRVALISFESWSQIRSGFTNNKDELIDEVNALTAIEATSYYQALLDVSRILKDYQKEENRECIVLFLTDGYPNGDVPNEEGQYQYLKKQYPYLTINGIQYEMGNVVLEPIKKVSDSQFIADMTNLNNVLFEAAIALSTYDDFLITDYINNDYFEIESVDSITANIGSTKLEYEGSVAKVIWDIRGLRSGSSATLTIDVNLKKEYIDKGGLYPTNKKEEVSSSIDKIKESMTSTATPVLADRYKVIYDGNVPGNCTIENVPSTTDISALETVEINNSVLVCEGYQFKGWELATKNVKKVDKNHFTMPSFDVLIRANWSKIGLVKSIDGEVFTAKSLYKIIEEQASLDNEKSKFVANSSGIDFAKAPSDTNGKGVYTMASTKDKEYPVHYFRGEVANNNVKFANFCWKIVRTTETGGVKLIYNGKPNYGGECINTTGTSTHIMRGSFNLNSSSPADIGYMYGTRYITGSNASLRADYWYNTVGKSRRYSMRTKLTQFYYGDSVSYDSETNMYTLNNAVKYSDYSILKGKYTCFKYSEEEGCESVSYIDFVDYFGAYYVNMTSGETYETVTEPFSNIKWLFGNDVEYNNGKYVLKDAMEYSALTFEDNMINGFDAHRYTCFGTENSCTDVNYLYYNNYYIVLKDGKKIDDVLNEMVTESSNTNSSNIKNRIDDWYSTYMTNYTSYLEDTVWCNDRSIYQHNGWDKDSTSNDNLYFGGRGRNVDSYKPSVECPNINDKFTVSSENGNGKLIYPVALLTVDEATLAGYGVSGYSDKSYLHTNQWWWLMSPNAFSSVNAGGFLGFSAGGLGINTFDFGGGIRPSVSLLPGVVVKDGNGSKIRPYEVDLPIR